MTEVATATDCALLPPPPDVDDDDEGEWLSATLPVT